LSLHTGISVDEVIFQRERGGERAQKESMVYLDVLPSLGKHTDEKNPDIIIIQALVHFGLVFFLLQIQTEEREREEENRSQTVEIPHHGRALFVASVWVMFVILMWNDHRLRMSLYFHSIAD
jgi:hypothetical protein